MPALKERPKPEQDWGKVFDYLNQPSKKEDDNFPNLPLIEQKKRISLKWLVLIVLLTYLIIGTILFCTLPWGMEGKGQFGDMFGALNGLISALAFGALVYSVWMQRDDLKNQNTVLRYQYQELQFQREELKLTREELARSTKAQTNSHIALDKQFQNMERNIKLEALNKIVEIYTDDLKDVTNVETGPDPAYMMNLLNLQDHFRKRKEVAKKQLTQLVEEILIDADKSYK